MKSINLTKNVFKFFLRFIECVSSIKPIIKIIDGWLVDFLKEIPCFAVALESGIRFFFHDRLTKMKFGETDYG